MRRFLLLAALCGPAEWLSAQSAPVMAPGNRVRIRLLTPSGSQADRIEGTIEHVSGDSITMLPKFGGRSRLYLPSPDTQLYVLTGYRSSLVRGATIGGVAGILAGGAWNLIRQEECVGNDYICVTRKPLAIKEGLVLTAAGAVVGLALGAIDRREVWTRAWMVEAQPDHVAGRGGLKVGFQLGF